MKVWCMVECILIGKGGRVMNDEGELIAEILCIAAELGGTVERTQTLNSVGRSSKKIIIEYDVQSRK